MSLFTQSRRLVLASAVGVFVLVLAALLGTSVGLAAGGTGPGDAFLPVGVTMDAAPHSQTWYKFDYSPNRADSILAALDANGVGGLTFKIYTPEAITNWVNGSPLTAVGASSSDASGAHDQVWKGRFNFPGTFYLVVENNTDASTSYMVRVTGDGVTTSQNVVPTATPLPNPFATPVPVGTLKGGKIVFQESSGGNIYTVNADGTDLKRVTFGLDPAFSHDGTRIAFSRQGPIPGLWISNADGSNERLVYGTPEVRSPSWSGDDMHVVFSTVVSTKTAPLFCFGSRCFGGNDVPQWRLKQYNVSDDGVTDPPIGKIQATVPSFNPVTNQIAFVSTGYGLLITSTEAGQNPTIVNDDQTINVPAYGPDGNRLTYMVRQPPVWQIVVAGSDGGNPTLLTHVDPLDFVHHDNVAPTFSPDGNQILFLSNRHGKWEFFAINPDGTGEMQVLKNITDGVNLQYNFSAERVASWVK